MHCETGETILFKIFVQSHLKKSLRSCPSVSFTLCRPVDEYLTSTHTHRVPPSFVSHQAPIRSPTCRRLLFPLLRACNKGNRDVCTQATVRDQGS